MLGPLSPGYTIFHSRKKPPVAAPQRGTGGGKDTSKEVRKAAPSVGACSPLMPRLDRDRRRSLSQTEYCT